MKLVKQLFTINGNEWFEGYHNPSQDWNGFACPYFTRENGESICQSLNCKFENGQFVDTENEDGELFEAIEKDTQDGILTLYPIGAYYWVWEVYEFPEH